MTDFDDLISANATYAETFDRPGMAAPADAHVCIVTCMDSRIDPLAVFGLGLGDAKVLRNPGGRVTDLTLEGIVLATTLLGCERVVIMEHTRCAVASNSLDELREKVAAVVGRDTSTQHFPSVADQHEQLVADVARVREHPLVPDATEVGGFVYDVDTGEVTRVV